MRWKTVVASAGVAGAIALAPGGVSPQVTHASPSPPPPSVSIYVTNNGDAPNSWLNGQGYLVGSNVNAKGNQVVALDWGKQALSGSTYGVVDFVQGAFTSDVQVAYATETFISGWMSGNRTCATVTIAVGTSNNHMGNGNPSYLPYSAGDDWGGTVNQVEGWVRGKGWQSRVQIQAADDIEQDQNGGWACPSETESFVNGFNAYGGGYFMLDYGDDEGMTISNPVDGCWTASDLYYVAYGANAEYPLPEIYDFTMATEWEGLDQWAVAYGNAGVMFFEGEMTQDTSSCTGQFCNNPGTGWSELYQQLGSDPQTSQSVLPWSTNIEWGVPS